MLRAGQDRVRAQPVLRGQGDGRQQVQHQPLPVREQGGQVRRAGGLSPWRQV